MEHLYNIITQDFFTKPLWMWFLFLAIVALLVFIDLGVFQKKAQRPSFKKSLYLSSFYISAALIFGIWVWWELGSKSALDFYTGYVVEKTLSLDNIFVIALIFASLKIPASQQHRILFWGILGVIVFRGIMIGFGAALIHNFEWILYIIAFFLIFTGVKMLFPGDLEDDFLQHPVMKFFSKHLRISTSCNTDKFIVREADKNGNLKLYFTPLLLALIMIETADAIFALDSITAILAITTDPFIVYTSSIFAVLGLRALYFVLANLVEKFVYLKYSLAIILMFIGSKVFIAGWLENDQVASWISLGFILTVLAAGMILSLRKMKGTAQPEQKNIND